MVDSAPELRFTTPSTFDAVVGAARGGVIHRLAGRVVAEEPRRGDAGDVTEAGTVGRLRPTRQQRLDTGMGAVGDLHAFGRRGQPPVLGPGRDEQVRREGGGVRQGGAAHRVRSPVTSYAWANPAGARPPHACQTAWDSAHGSTAPNGQVRGSPDHMAATPSPS